MNYKNKIQLAESYIEKMASGTSKEIIETELLESGITRFDLKKIKSSVTKIIEGKYIDKIIDYLLAQNLDNHLDEFELVDQDEFESLQLKALSKIKHSCDSQTRSYYNQGLESEEILKRINNPYYTIEDVENKIEKIQYYEEPSKWGNAYSLGGILLMIAGTFMSIATMHTGEIKIYFGMIIGGLVMFFVKGTKTQFELDEKKRGHFFNWRSKKER